MIDPVGKGEFAIAAIQVLSSQLSELISAGEVVDRPASIVKELVENAIDAGAHRVTIEAKRGGITYLRVSDDGVGIHREEVSRAFIRHATSKISSAADLDAIGTLGFRGEALPSIAAVSRVTLTTRTRGCETGCRYHIDGSGETSIEDIGCAVGTVVEVRDVFYNTPARMKFLKRDVTEGNAIASLLDRLALANPSVSFEFIRDKQRKLMTPGDGDLLSVIRIVCGSQIASQMIPVSLSSDGIQVTGYLSGPSVFRSSRSLQTCFVNARYVHSRTCVNAVEESYKNRLMGGRFPAFVLNLGINTGLVDVNVHPAKLEVRFSSERTVYNAVYAACVAALSAQDCNRLPSAHKITPMSLNDFDYSDRQLTIASSDAMVFFKDTTGESPHPMRNVEERLPPSVATPVRSVAPSRFHPPPDIEWEVCPPSEPVAPIPQTTQVLPPIPESDPSASRAETLPPPKEEPVAWHLIGELFDTYILVEQGDTFLLIDKHAAHERSIYEQIKHLGKDGERQLLLTPTAVTLSRDEYFALTEHPEALTALGITAEDFGEQTVLVREIPMLLDGCDLTELLSEAASRLLKLKTDLTPVVLDELLYSVSCRAAVMAGKRSSLPELEKLAALVLGEDAIRFCPHGRPALISMQRREIEKMFGRLG